MFHDFASASTKWLLHYPTTPLLTVQYIVTSRIFFPVDQAKGKGKDWDSQSKVGFNHYSVSKLAQGPKVEVSPFRTAPALFGKNYMELRVGYFLVVVEVWGEG